MRFSRACLLGLLACLAVASAVLADDIQVNDPDTVVLTDANFDDFVAADLSLVEFYAPWCGHCKSLAPEYALAATQLKALGVPIGKLDATVHSKTAGAHSVSGYPTLKVFRNGKPTDYTGPRKADGIVAYMKKQVGPPARVITTDAELQALLVQEPSVQYVVMAFFNEGKASQLQSSFSILANRMRDEFLFARTTDSGLRAKYGVAEGSEALVAFLQADQTRYEGSSKTSDVEAFIRQNSLPLVGEYSEATANIYAARKLPVAKLFINVDRKPRSQTMRYFSNRLKKLATQFAGKVLIAYADRTGQKAQLEHLNMQEDENGFVIDDIAGGKQYKYDADDYEDDEDNAAAAASAKKKKGGLDIDGFEQFISDFLEGDVSPYVKSQKAPKDNLARPVKMATGQNFDDLVNDDEKDVMIEFYAPWCGHCKALEPKYEQLGQKLKGEKGVVIAKIDATANDYDRKKWEVSGYPTVFFKPAGKKATVYDGPREVDDMYSFIKKKAKTLKKGGGEKKKKKKSKKSE